MSFWETSDLPLKNAYTVHLFVSNTHTFTFTVWAAWCPKTIDHIGKQGHCIVQYASRKTQAVLDYVWFWQNTYMFKKKTNGEMYVLGVRKLSVETTINIQV